jgi:hypothetical protein
MSTIGKVASNERGRGALNHWRRGSDPVTGSRTHRRAQVNRSKKLELKDTLMKPLTITNGKRKRWIGQSVRYEAIKTGTFQVASSSAYVGKRPPGRFMQNKGTT